jgi:alcohol dehydrogenase class IV
LAENDLPAIVEKTLKSSSLKGNPIQLTTGELTDILKEAL